MNRIEEIKKIYEDIKDQYIFEEYEKLASITGELISRLEQVEEENKKFRVALDIAHVVLERYESMLKDAGL
ncbi:hypothetical protein AB6A23_11105 [Paenibacillus tarimensis]